MKRRLAVIAAAALAVRVAWTAWTTQGGGELRGDAIGFYQGGKSLADSLSLVGESGRRSARMPGYPFFLSLVFRLAGPSVPAVQAAQALLGAGTCALVYAGGTWLSPGAALFAGWAAVFYYGLVDPCGRILAECFFAFWLAAFFFSWFRWRGQAWATGLLIAAGAALYLTRPEGIFAGLAAGLAGPWLKEGWRRRHSALLLGCLAATAGAWGLRNRAVLGTFLPGTTGAGFSLWAAIPRTMYEKLGSDLGARPEEPVSAGELDRDIYYRGQALRTMKSAPASLVLKAAAFNLASEFYPFLPGYELTYGALAPLCLYAVWAFRRRRELWPAFFLIGAWSLLYIVYGGADSRFRQLYAPLLLWLAAAGLQSLRERLSRDAFRKLAAGWTAGNVLVFALSPHFRGIALAFRDLAWTLKGN